MSYPLAFRLLIEAQKLDIHFYEDIQELVNWARIGNSSYSLETLAHFNQLDIELDEIVSS